MSEIELDGARPSMVSISLKAMKDIISLLKHELTEGEFESDVEYLKVKKLLDECRQADESAGQIVWHPVKLVPYDPAKHAEIFEDMPIPKEVWEGEMPSEEGEYLVTTKGGYVGLDEFDMDWDGGWFETDSVIAWAELPEPYKEGN